MDSKHFVEQSNIYLSLRIGRVQLLPGVVVIKDPGVVGRGSMRSVVFRYRRLSGVVLKNLDVICWLFGESLW